MLKKIGLALGVLLLCFCFTGCSDKQYVKEISYSDFKKMIEEKQTFILEVMSSECSACKDFDPKIKEVANENKVTVHQLNIKKMSNEEWLEFSKNYSVSATPTTVFYTEGKEETVATRINGSVSKDKIVSKFQSMGYISK